MNEHWIPISFNDGATTLALQAALKACHQVHSYTVITLNDYFIDHAAMYPYHNFRRELGLYIREHNLTEYSQRYSLMRAAERTFPYFNENKKIKKKKFISVKPISLDQYQQIQIESRQIWRKYLALNNLITTTYGTIFLDESWVDTLTVQAEEKKIDLKLTAFLIHSIVVDLERMTLRFNLHEPRGLYGRKAKKEMRLQRA